jgi:glycerol-3-phosphate acyltransferase PlsX
MGGDRAPEAPVHGVLAALELAEDLEVVLVGPSHVLQPLLADHGDPRLSFVDAAEMVGEEAHPALRVRQRTDASVVRTVRLLAEGRADAAVSVGNTGAVLAAAVIELGLLPGLHRPVVAGRLPVAPRTLLADLGANADVSARHFVDFAHLAVTWHHVVFGDELPTVALLANGREPGKGTPRIREAAERLRLESVDFRGFAEPQDLLAGRFDVVLVDGYVGNLVLKTVEALSGWYAERLARVAVGAADERLHALRSEAEELSDLTRSAPAITVLGVNGTVVPGHGRASAADITRLVLRAKQAVEHDDAGRLRHAWLGRRDAPRAFTAR